MEIEVASRGLLSNAIRVALSVAAGACLAPAVLFGQTAAPSVGSTAKSPSAAATPDDPLAEIVVTGYRASLVSAERAKREAAEVIEAITPEELGKFSDNSIADALQRVPGVQVNHDDDGRTGETVSIRGMGANFTTVTFNGRSFGGYGFEGYQDLRRVDADVFPSEILGGATIYKTPSAELVESGLGGEVDFQTLKPLDARPAPGNGLISDNFFGSITARGQIVDGTPRDGSGVSGYMVGKLLDGTLGLYVAGTKSKTYLNSYFDEVRPLAGVNVNVQDLQGNVSRQTVVLPQNPDIGERRTESDRSSADLGLQWKPTENFEVMADYLYDVYNRLDNRDYTIIDYNPNPTGVFKPGGITIANGYVTQLNYADYTPGTGDPASQSTTALNSLGYNNYATSQLGGINAKFHDEHWLASVDYSQSDMHSYNDLPLLVSPTFNVPNSVANYNTAPGTPAIYNQGFTMPTAVSALAPIGVFRRFELNNTDTQDVKGDVAYKVNDNWTMKAGARWAEFDVDVRTLQNFTLFSAAQSAAIAPVYVSGGSVNLFPGQNIGQNLQPQQNAMAAIGLLASTQPPYNLSSFPFRGGSFSSLGAYSGGWGLDANQTYNVKENTLAGYFQVDGRGTIGGLDWGGNAGIRIVRTKETMLAFQAVNVFPSVANPQLTEPLSDNLVSATNTYTTPLPAINWTLHPNDRTNVRLAFNRSLSRPEFEQMAPINTVNIPPQGAPAGTVGFGTVGNPNLKPILAWNYDATVEHYSASGGAYVVSTFYKKVSNFVTFNSVTNTQLPGFGSQLFNTSTFTGNDTGRAYGAEFGFDQPLKQAWRYLDGFGVSANYTYVDSRIDQLVSGFSLPFTDSSRNNVNATFYYADAKLDARVSYIYRSNFLSAYPWGGIVYFPTFTEGYGDLDLSLSYKFLPHLQATFTATNLTQAHRYDYIANTNIYYNYYNRPSTYMLALRAVF